MDEREDEQSVVDDLISAAILAHDAPRTRKLGARLASLWDSIQGGVENGVLLPFDEAVLDPVTSKHRVSLLKGHVSPARLRELEAGDDLTEGELDAWRCLVAEQHFEDNPEPYATWEIVPIESSRGINAFVAHILEGRLSVRFVLRRRIHVGR